MNKRLGVSWMDIIKMSMILSLGFATVVKFFNLVDSRQDRADKLEARRLAQEEKVKIQQKNTKNKKRK